MGTIKPFKKLAKPALGRKGPTGGLRGLASRARASSPEQRAHRRRIGEIFRKWRK